jgi:hypothetical protein
LSFGLSFAPADFDIGTSDLGLYIGGRSDRTQRFAGQLDEIRISNGLVLDESLLGDVAADYQYDDAGGSTGANAVKTACAAESVLTGRMGDFSDGTAEGTVSRLRVQQCRQ